MLPDVDPAMLIFQMLISEQAENPKMATEKINSMPNGLLEQVLLFSYQVSAEGKIENYKDAIASQIEEIVMPLDTCIKTTFPISMEGHE
tara:strand:- start:35485 stop:35751 length:267 start_codon:yes stop_codon:yes gene_type:complete